MELALQKLRINDLIENVAICGYEENRRSQLIGSILEDNSDENPLVLYRDVAPSQSVPVTYKKIELSVTPSAFGASQYDHLQQKKENHGLIYQHWFALEVYESYHALLEIGSETVSVGFGKQIFQIDGTHLNDFVDELSRIFLEWPTKKTIYFQSSRIDEVENSHTGAISRSLDRFLFADKDKGKGACFHQMPTSSFVENGSRKTHKADVLVCKLENKVPDKVILASGYKIGSTISAFHETVACCIESANMYRKRNVVLGLVGSGSMWQLLVCHNLENEQLRVIQVIKAQLGDDMRKFACVMYASVHYLIDNKVSHVQADNIVARCKDGFANDHVGITQRVVHCIKANRIHKYYDLEEKNGKPNYELIDRMKLLPNATLMELSSDKRFYQLSYDYLAQSEFRLVKLKDFVPLLHQLSKLHAEDFVHSDVRCANIIFTSEGARLIDFDLVEKEGQKYPETYNCRKIEERFSSSMNSEPREKRHDRYSIYKSMKMKTSVPEAIKNQLLSSETLLSDIADAIENM